MKKTKRNAVLVIIAFLLILGVAIYTAIFGVADRGKVEYIKLGLDRKGGLITEGKIHSAVEGLRQ